MMKFVDSAIEDADVFLMVTEKADASFEENLVGQSNKKAGDLTPAFY